MKRSKICPTKVSNLYRKATLCFHAEKQYAGHRNLSFVWRRRKGTNRQKEMKKRKKKAHLTNFTHQPLYLKNLNMTNKS